MRSSSALLSSSPLCSPSALPALDPLFYGPLSPTPRSNMAFRSEEERGVEALRREEERSVEGRASARDSEGGGVCSELLALRSAVLLCHAASRSRSAASSCCWWHSRSSYGQADRAEQARAVSARRSLCSSAGRLLLSTLLSPQIISAIGLARGGSTGYMIVKIVILVIAVLGQRGEATREGT